LADVFHFGGARLRDREHADFGAVAEPREHGLHAGDQHVRREGQRQRDAENERVEKRRSRRGREPCDRAPEAVPVVTQRRDHASRPLARCSTRGERCPKEARSWVATTTVTPTRLKSTNRSSTSRAVSSSRLEVGSSASTTLGRLTTARA